MVRLGGRRCGVVSFASCCRHFSFWSRKDKGTILLGVCSCSCRNFIGDSLCQLRRNGVGLLNGLTHSSCYIITTIDMIDDDVVTHVFTIDIDIGMSSHICLTCTTKDIALDVTSRYGDRSVTRHITSIATTIDITTNLDLRYAP